MANRTGTLHGKKGCSGRLSYGLEKKIGAFKHLAWDLILEECKDKNKLREYIKMFSVRLMPQQIEGTGEEGEFKFKITGGNYAL